MAARDFHRESTREAFIEESASLRFSSPLFATLAGSCAQDKAMLELGSVVRYGQPIAMLIMLTAQYLLFKYRDAELAQYFPSLTEEPQPRERAFPAFRQFCLDHRQEMLELLSYRTVNTNLVERASCIMPLLLHVERLAGEPLTLVEMCCSSGLSLIFDEYHYDYGPAGQLGVAGSPVQLGCRLIGTGFPPVNAIPTLKERMGLDLVKIDPRDEQERMWMEAMLCPEWKLERAHLRAALKLRAERDLRVYEGDGLKVLPQLLEGLSGPVCVLHSYCMGQWSAAAQAELDGLLRKASTRGNIHRVGIEVPVTESPRRVRSRMSKLAAAGIPLLQKSVPSCIEHWSYTAGQGSRALLGQSDVFGAWLDWYSSPE